MNSIIEIAERISALCEENARLLKGMKSTVGEMQKITNSISEDNYEEIKR